MKKFILMMAIAVFLMGFIGCGDGENNNNDVITSLQIKNESSMDIIQPIFRSVLFSTLENADVIGTWIGKAINHSNLTLTLTIADNAWSAVTQGEGSDGGRTGQGQWTRNGNAFIFTSTTNSGANIQNSSATLAGNVLTGNFNVWGSVYQFTLSSDNLQIPAIKSGTSVTRSVEAGSGYIFFRMGSADYRTNELIVVGNKEKAEFIFTNNTLVVDVNNPSTPVILGGPMITVKQDNFIIEQNSEFNFGTVRSGNTREIIFTIENTGGSNMIIENVNGNRINLTDNNTGFYSVNLQPLTTTISHGNNTTFTIRFTPSVLGSNIAATVQIKSNSHIGEFSFRVIGNCSNEYQIGDTGPGGGLVFFAQGGQYGEVSGELGINNWNNADIAARGFRGNSFTDWRLPDRSELNLIYENLHLQGLGGFSNAFYWSSHRLAATLWVGERASSKEFQFGSWDEFVLSNSLIRFRAVRSFTD
jgi:hypothetical protein